MKKIVAVLSLSAVLALSVPSLAFAGYGAHAQASGNCGQRVGVCLGAHLGHFADADGDGICDNRGTQGTGNGGAGGLGNGTGAAYVDGDGDGICDNSGMQHGNGAGRGAAHR